MPYQKDELLATVRDALRRAETYCHRIRPWDTRLLLLSIVCGAIASVLAGTIAVKNDAFGGRYPLVCGIAALFTVSGTVAGALHKSLQITTRVSGAEKCVVRLRALEMSIAASDIPPDSALEAFKRIAEDHSVCLV